MEEASSMKGFVFSCEVSYRMWEMNKQMPPLQPLLDLTLLALPTLSHM